MCLQSGTDETIFYEERDGLNTLFTKNTSFSPLSFFLREEYHSIVLCGRNVFVQSFDLFLFCKEEVFSISVKVRNNIEYFTIWKM